MVRGRIRSGRKGTVHRMKAVSQIISSLEGKDIKVSLTKKLAFSRTINGTRWYMQGGGTDGTYGYYAINSGGDSRESATLIYKVDLAAWQIVKISQPLYMSHANDIAYDPKHHRLIVSWCDIEPDKVAVVDPDTLVLLETKQIPQRHFSIAYCAERGRYVAGKSRTYDLALLDDDFQPVALLPGVEGYIKQGLECDEDYIYFFQTGTDANWIFIFNWNGSLIRKISVPMVGESENLFIRGDKLICAFNDREHNELAIYEAALSEKI